MKPDWKDAPEWANYLAQNDDGSWYWHEFAPSLVAYGGVHEWVSCGESKPARKGWTNWMEPRP